MMSLMTMEVDDLDPSRDDPRVERTRAHVLSQARHLLAIAGPSAVTYSELAARARVTRQTLYRHWPTREALFVDLVLEQSMDGLPDDEGTPEQIVGNFLRQMRHDMGDPAHAGPLLAVVAAADHEPASCRALGRVVNTVREGLNALLEPSGHSVSSHDYIRLCGPVIFGRLIAREPVTDQFIDSLVAAWSASRSSVT